MKFSAAFLSLASMASAIDLWSYSNRDCGGNAGVCRSINPNICCSTGGSSGLGSSASAHGIPIGWLIELRAFTGGDCTNLAATAGSGGGQTSICIRGGFFTGMSYNFYGRKRGETVESDCQRPDTLVLTDGSEYDISGLDDETFSVLYPLGLNATGPEDVPQELKSLQIK
ncbi:hypothetical protein B0I35DRAFT_515522 [Stachybotrys elegans]|uniref:Hydrophobin n=1 Tax=Stachybotrys elegans TaxID=80388 RepID=A0A8K0WLL2_9HYPO|nr:hypothetical protein B0I35DRAFT_515522 [Stachybotrys elegans]